MNAEDEKLVRRRKAATQGATGLSLFALIVFGAIWGALFHFFPQYLNPMHVFDGIQDGSMQRDTVNFFAGISVILFHVSWLLLLAIIFVSARGLRRERRLVDIIERISQSAVSKTGVSGSWKME